MSGAYTADGRRRSSMTHAQHGHECDFCGRIVFGNGGVVSHGRAHVRAGEAIEVVKEYPYGISPSRFFLPLDAHLAWWTAKGYTYEAPMLRKSEQVSA